jgi:hypothetical protein
MAWFPRQCSARFWLAVVIATLGAVTALVAQNSTRWRATSAPELIGRAVQVNKELLQREREAALRGESRQVNVIVRLVDDALTRYPGNIAGLPATNPRSNGLKKVNAQSANSQRYLAYLSQQHDSFKERLQRAIPASRVGHEYSAVLNGLSVSIPETQISTLASLPGVAGVYEDTLLKPDTEVSPEFIGAPTIWNGLGGQFSAAENVVVGVLDTGIWPEHPSFADPDPSGKPYQPRAGGPALPCTFGSSLPNDAVFTCNNKLIGARVFLNTYSATIGLGPNEYPSARDNEGHGTHTTSTAAGNGGVNASILGRSFGVISGIAPRAKIITYKVCAIQGCTSSDSAAAVNQAILDGVDVINFSIDGGNSPYSDAVSLAFLDAYAGGVFVAASAGNSGPSADTVGHREPWTTTVAASTTNRQFQAVLTLSAGAAALVLRGASVTNALSTPTPVVNASDAPYNDGFCLNAAADGAFAGKVVVCKRGFNERSEKGYNVKQRGAVGMILYNPSLQGVETDNHFLPTVHLEVNDGTSLLSFLTAHLAVNATITAGTATQAQGDVIARFSSRGGSDQSLGISKPDISAPGVQILAGHTPTPSTFAGDKPGELFWVNQGTSMASPHIAGSAALLTALHPTWTPGQIRSALMTTANSGVVKEDGTTPAGAFDFGSGRVDLAHAGNPGLLMDESAENYVLMQSHLWDTNYPSVYVAEFPGEISMQRTLHSTRNQFQAWKLKVSAPPDLQVIVPSTIDVPAQGDAALNIKLVSPSLAVGHARQALIELSRPNETTLRIPITVVRRTSLVPLTKSCNPLTIQQNAATECTITVTNTSGDSAQVVVNDLLQSSKLRLVSGSVSGATQINNNLTFSGVLAGGEPPNVFIGPGSSPAGGYLPLAPFGISALPGVTDDTILNVDVPAFLFGGEVYTRIGIASNGYAVIGGGSGSDISFANQSFPNPARPNNVLAPFWTDLNPEAAGALRAGLLMDGTDEWIVLEWQDVREFSLPRTASFQIWIGVNSDAHPAEDISFAYGTIQGTGEAGLLTVGVENRLGNRGQNHYYNGAGTLPGNGTQLRVTTTPATVGATHVITFSAIGLSRGTWTNCAEMSGSVFYGIQQVCVNGTTVK